MPFLYDNHQAEKDFGEIENFFFKYGQQNAYVKIAYNSFFVVYICLLLRVVV